MPARTIGTNVPIFPAPTVYFGVTRCVFITGGLAFKVARSWRGRECNLHESQVWEQNQHHPQRRRSLCPVLWADPSGVLLVMPAARPVLAEDLSAFELARDEADDAWFIGIPDDGSPWEGKPQDWGVLDGQFVCLDYSRLALFDWPTLPADQPEE